MMRRQVVALLAVAFAASCTGTDTGNPYPQRLVVDAHSSDPTTFAVTLADGGGVVAQAWLSLEHIGFVAEGDPACAAGQVGTDDALDLGVADHAVAGPTTLDITLTAGDFCTIAVPFVAATAPLPAGAPPELEGGSIALTGTTAAGNDFLIVSERVATITLTGPAAIALDPDTGSLFLGFDVAAWLDGLDIDGASSGGAVVIDADNNADLLADLEDNLAAGIELYRDNDENGAADPGDDQLAVGQ